MEPCICINAIHHRNQPDLGVSLLNPMAVLRRLLPRRDRPIQKIVVGDVFALRLVALKAGAERTKQFRKSLMAADAGRHPTAEKMVMRRARRESILITSSLGGIRSAARQIRELMNKSLTVLSAAKRFLLTTTSGESTSLGVLGCRGQIKQLFYTHNISFIYTKFRCVPMCYFIQCTVIHVLMPASSLSWQLQEQGCFSEALAFVCLGDCDHRDR